MSNIRLDEYTDKINILIQEGSFEQAAYHCLYLLHQFPRCFRLYEQYGRILFESDDTSSAYDVFARKLAVVPDGFLNHVTIGLILEENGHLEAAAFHFRTALDLQPGNEEIFNNLHRICKKMSRPNVELVASHFTSGIVFYREKKFSKATHEFKKSFEYHESVLSELFLGLSLFYAGQTEEAIPILEKILAVAPYLLSALVPLAGYWKDKNPQKFSMLLRRLSDLDPRYEQYTVTDGLLTTGNNSIIVNYQDWTGFPNTKLRIGWQQTDNQFLSNDISCLPNWLGLIPLCPQFLYSIDKQEEMVSATKGLLSGNNKLYTSSHIDRDAFLQMDFFRTQATVSNASHIQKPPKQTDPEETVSKPESAEVLDQAFKWLETMVNEDSVARKDNPQPPIQTSHDTMVTVETADKVPSEPIDDEILTKIREAWKCFSSNEQDRGIALYNQLINEGVGLERIREDLKQLKVLFPEYKGLSELNIGD